MAQLRQDYKDFVDRDTEVIAVGPDSQKAFVDYWEENDIPFIGLADPDNEVAKLYDQEVNLLKFGRIPSQMLIDKQGIVRYAHYSNSMSDIPDNVDMLNLIDEING
ncbi:MAG TPA: thioredoxin peroxidase [Anaerolineaceae bacterium]|jgi:peroxiredoxin Q/BCP|nr:MAG: thioredoxin peroxidase [Marinimicrobia bacterium 46_43]HAF47670.1 thioredoxin peroxidase [Anaerolineaceae bacterium]